MWNCYERRRRITRTIMNWEIKTEVWLLWEKKNDQKNDEELRNEMEIEIEIVMREEEGPKEWWRIKEWNGNWDCYERRRRIKRMMKNWEVKLQQLWEKKKD
jgi:hypothetical protein